jgi:hypothetical protein
MMRRPAVGSGRWWLMLLGYWMIGVAVILVARALDWL